MAGETVSRARVGRSHRAPGRTLCALEGQFLVLLTGAMPVLWPEVASGLPRTAGSSAYRGYRGYATIYPELVGL